MDKKMSLEMRAVGSLTILMIGVGTMFYHWIEAMAWVDAFYFAVITLTTVGYGDIYPVTTFGKLFTAFYVLTGVGILVAFASLYASYLVNNRLGRITGVEKEE